MRVFLVDFENVKSEGLRCVDCLAQGDQVITFFSKNAESINMDTYFHLIQSKASFYAVRLDRTGKNALDFQLVSYLGYLMGTSEHQDVYVISTDHGFYSAVSFCRNFLIPQSKYHKTVTQYPSIASLFPNQQSGRAEGINAIPLFLKNDRETPVIVQAELAPQEEPVEEQPDVQQEPVVSETPVKEPEQEPVHESVKEPEQPEKAEEDRQPTADALPVQPKRRSNSRQRNGGRDNRDNRDRRPAPQPVKSGSDWDEISAAAEVGLQVIDMFGDTTPKEQPAALPPVAEKAVAEKPAADQPIEIIDLLSPMKEPEVKEEPKPVEQPKQTEVTEQPVEQSEPEIAVEPEQIPEPVAEPEMEPTLDSTANGAEIDQMLEEFLEEAQAAIEAEMQKMPDDQDMPAFIEVDVNELQQPAEESEPDAVPEEKPQKNQPRTRRGRPRKVKPQAEQSAPENKEQPKTEAEKPVKSEQPKQKPEQPKAEQVKPEQPKQKPEQSKQAKPAKAEPEKSDPPVKNVTPEARELVKKVLTGTLEMNDEETGDDLEKLTDCIVNASGKQDLYRMIIKIFGQKTGLEYYKVVKREYTNISNQIINNKK